MKSKIWFVLIVVIWSLLLILGMIIYVIVEEEVETELKQKIYDLFKEIRNQIIHSIETHSRIKWFKIF